jgi:hypothetical protein
MWLVTSILRLWEEFVRKCGRKKMFQQLLTSSSSLYEPASNTSTGWLCTSRQRRSSVSRCEHKVRRRGCCEVRPPQPRQLQNRAERSNPYTALQVELFSSKARSKSSAQAGMWRESTAATTEKYCEAAATPPLRFEDRYLRLVVRKERGRCSRPRIYTRRPIST